MPPLPDAAADDASGVAALLESASWMLSLPRRHDLKGRVQFVASDMEENDSP